MVVIHHGGAQRSSVLGNSEQLISNTVIFFLFLLPIKTIVTWKQLFVLVYQILFSLATATVVVAILPPDLADGVSWVFNGVGFCKLLLVHVDPSFVVTFVVTLCSCHYWSNIVVLNFAVGVDVACKSLSPMMREDERLVEDSHLILIK